jgi:hypothetical protein
VPRPADEYYHPDREKARLTKMLLRYIGSTICNLAATTTRAA